MNKRIEKLSELMAAMKGSLPEALAKDAEGIEKERFERAKQGSKEDKLFIYEKIKRILEQEYKESVNSGTIDALLKQHYINYFENLYFQEGKDSDRNFDSYSLERYEGKVDSATMEVFRKCREKLLFKPSRDKDIIELFEQFKLSSESPYSEKLDRLARIIYQSIWGYGPIEDFIDQSETFNDIGSNRFDYIWVQVKGRKRPLRKLRFKDHGDYRRVLNNIARYNGAGDITPANPKIECSIMDMQRVTILAPPIVRPKCEVLRVRNQAVAYISLEELVERGSISLDFYKFMHLVLPGHPNITIFGGQGIGKTTIANALIDALPFDRVQATQESSHELFSDMRFPLKNIIGLQTVPGFEPEEIYALTLRMCLDNGHYGEIRTPEDAYMAKQTVTRQCRGSVNTVHFSDAQGCIEGFAELISTHLQYHDHRMMRYSVARMLNILIAPHRDEQTGRFYVKSVYEVHITDRDAMKYDITEIFRYNRESGTLEPVEVPSDYTKQLLMEYDVTESDWKKIEEIFNKAKIKAEDR